MTEKRRRSSFESDDGCLGGLEMLEQQTSWNDDHVGRSGHQNTVPGERVSLA